MREVSDKRMYIFTELSLHLLWSLAILFKRFSQPLKQMLMSLMVPASPAKPSQTGGT